MSKVLIAGGTGLVGNRISQLLTKKGYGINLLSRKKNSTAKYPTYVWNTNKNFIEERAFEGVEYVINLAGTGIADALWTKSRKKLIIDSRVETTKLLTNYIQKLAIKPKVYIAAAAIGIYGDRGGEELTEESAIGKKGFLVESCVAWENAIRLADEQNGIRTAALRVGVVLSTKGGALPKMMLPINFFTASYFGNGEQWYSWIHIDDVCRMFIKVMEDESIVGFYNATTPNPLTNKDLTKQLVKALGKKAIVIPAPKAALRLGMGEMADVVLNSNKVFPARMQMAGFKFDFPEFRVAIKNLVTKEI